MRNANGFGSIIKLSGKRRRPFAVRITAGWTDAGKQILKYISYHEKKSEAKIALAEYNKNPYDVDLARITFAEVYEKWSAEDFETLAESSVNAYKGAYKRCSTLYDKVFRELRKIHLQDVINEIDAYYSAEATKLMLQKMYKYAMENDIVEKDYAKFIKLPTKPETKEKTPFTKEEIAALWDGLDVIKNADMALILLYTGMRIGELLDMKKEDIHLEERYMIGGKKTKAGKNRVIPIHKRIVPLIERRMRISKNEWLMVNRYGEHLQYSSVRKYYWPDLMKEIKAAHTPHDTRHTFISNMDRVEKNTILIKRIVGHATSDITEHYTHKDIEELIAAVDKLE